MPLQTADFEPYATVGETAHRIGCSDAWVRSLIRQGRLQAVWSKRGWWVEHTSIDAFLAGRERPRQARKAVA